MIEQMKALVKKKKTCVLATAFDNKPHCSLMAYVTDHDCREIYMVTSRKTKKFRNLSENPAVSLLVDTREEAYGAEHPRAKALTISGIFAPLTDEDKKSQIRTAIAAQHPDIQELVEHPDSEILCIKIVSFLLLNGPTETHFEKVE